MEKPKDLIFILEEQLKFIKITVTEREYLNNTINKLKKAINHTHCCETLNTKDRIAFHVFAKINKYEKCFEGYYRDGKIFSETDVLKRYNTYLQSL